jgi:KaiC/GvpD/RAD55 family RecA-like ATPase
MQEWLERECEEWATELVFEYFEDVSYINDLTEEQIEEVMKEYERLDYEYGDMVSFGFAQVLRRWEDETGKGLDW